MLRSSGIGVQRPHTADQSGHFRHGERQQACPIDQRFGRRHALAGVVVVPEAVRFRLQEGDRDHVGLLLRGVGAPGVERNGHRMAAILRGLFDGGGAAEDDHVRERDFLALLRSVEVLLDAFQATQHFGQLAGVVSLPILLRREANARSVGTAAHVRSAERSSRRPGHANQLRDTQPRGEDRRLQFRDILGVNQRMIDFRERILPN